jgi:GNAT superfamily N-acetyltransferase
VNRSLMNLHLSDLYQACGEDLALYFRAAPNRDLRLTAHSWLAASGEPVADLNLMLVDASSGAEDQLRAFHHVLDARNLPALCLLTPAVADPLAPVATALGMTFAGKMPVMVCAAVDLPETDPGRYSIKLVATAEALAAVCTILAQAFNLAHALDVFQRILGAPILAIPGLTIYLAYEDGQPVSTVTTTAAGPLVGVWSMGTLPAYQRQGVGRALLGYAMAQQRACGTKHFYLGSSEAGQRLYAQLGYRTVAELSVWTTGQSVQVHA